MLVVAWAALAAACDGETMETDAGPDDGGIVMDGDTTDPCDDVTTCATAGSSCSGDEVVTCAPNADGCLVETTTDCAAMDRTCDDSGADAMCVTPDPCEAIPAADRCDTEGRSCDGDTLEICAANEDGCLVREATDCAAMEGGACDTSGAMPMCVLPEDPCAGVADACAAEGTSCDGDSLVTCEPNAFGCLVETRDDCSARASGTCDASGAAAECTFTGDPCDGITQCAAAGASCDGPTLVECEADAYGCLVETRTDCTDGVAFGFCDTDATPAAMCSTAATDPCMGVTECAAAGRTCSGDSLVSCEANAFGCLVESTTDCAATSESCGELDGVNVCAPVCDFRATCPSATYCDGADVVTCTPDADSCLVEDSRTTCPGACDAAACVGNCASAAPVVIDCASGTVSGDTAMGGAAITSYAPCTTSTSYAGNEQVFVFRNATRAAVEVVSTRGASSGDFDLFVLDGGDGTAACDSGLSCLDSSRGVTATETVDFVAEAGAHYYVVFDRFSSTTSTSAFDLAVTCTPIVCGDGLVTGDEQCDDGGTATGDGCSDTCTFEPGYICSGAPSTCEIACGNGTTDTAVGEECDDGGTTAGDGCSDTCAVEAGYICSGAPSTCEVACGNGTTDTAVGEECDDGGTTAGDGCSDTCTVEAGFACSGTPSTCTALPMNRDCSGAVALGANDSTLTPDLDLGGARPTGTGCGSGSGNVLWYAVTVPAGSSTTVSADPTGSTDLTLHVLDACGAPTCLDFEDSGNPEEVVLVNGTASDVVRYVAVGAYFSFGSGTVDVTTSTPVCGDGTTSGLEDCDDGNTTAGDGCSDTCEVEPGYVCGGAPSMCEVACGNGVVDRFLGEQCDDGGTATGDGCSDTFAFEAGYYCEGTPSVCSMVMCGDSTVDAGESCDDGNTTVGDGCSGNCALEIAASGMMISATGALEATDPTFVRAEASCTAGTTSGHYYDAYVIENTTGSAQTLDITASWMMGAGTDDDGFLLVYDYPFVPSQPIDACLDGSDDGSAGVTSSEVTGLPIAAGQRVVIVATTYDPAETIGSYTLDVATN